MDWGSITIRRVTIDLKAHTITVNGGVVCLKAKRGKEKEMRLAHAVAFGSKCCPMHKTINGLTLEWLKAQYGNLLKSMGLRNGNSLSQVWYQGCLNPETWRVLAAPEGMNGWLDAGHLFLMNLFLSKPLDREQRHVIDAPKNTHRMCLPDDAEIVLIPDAADPAEAVELCKPEGCGVLETEKEAGKSTAWNKGGVVTSGSSADTLLPNEAGIFEDSRSAIRYLSCKMPSVEEVLFVGYTSRMLAEDLRTLKPCWRIGRLRLLVRDMDCVDGSLPDDIPNDTARIRGRREESRFNPKDPQEERDSICCDQADVRYYRGLCCVRALLVRRNEGEGYTAGLFSMYKRRGDTGPREFGARKSPVLLLSSDDPYQKVILDSIANWFKVAWDEGSHP